MELTSDDKVYIVKSFTYFATSQVESYHSNTVFVALQESFTVAGLASERGIELQSAYKRLETELVGVRMFKHFLELGELV